MKKLLLTGATLAVGFGLGFVLGAHAVVRQYETGRVQPGWTDGTVGRVETEEVADLLSPDAILSLLDAKNNGEIRQAVERLDLERKFRDIFKEAGGV